jgi:DNA-binding NtrC family response regulator
VVAARSSVLFREDFPDEIFKVAELPAAGGNDGIDSAQSGENTPPTLAILERDYIKATLERVSFKKNKAAEILGIDRVTLHRKIRRYGISATTLA